MKLYFETYGCSANQNNTEIMKGLALRYQHKIVDTADESEAVIINSCIVKGPTENRIRRRIEDYRKQNKIIILAGCMPNVRKEEFKSKKIYLLGTKNILDLPKLLLSLSSIITDKCEIKLSTEKIPESPIIGITQISEGCLGSCTYCATKLAKGSLYSFPEEQILASVKLDLEKGCKEIWLTSQDLASYGQDSGEPKLPELLKKIINLPYDFYLRLGMMNPNNVLKIKKALIEIFKSNKVYKFLHIPVQSGSNKILKDMNRFYTKEDFLELAKEFRNEIPNITISTDIIVGFPGESENDFIQTLDLIKEVKPEFLNISKYWPMKGTTASKLSQLKREVVKARLIETHKLYKSFFDNSKWIDWQGKVLVNEISKARIFARNIFYKRIFLSSKENIFGKFINIKIAGTKKNYLVAQIT